MDNTPQMMRSFEPPPAADLLMEFRKQYEPLIERRMVELRDQVDNYAGDKSSEEYTALCREYFKLNDLLNYFEPQIHRVIHAFVNEALRPWQRAFTDALVSRPEPFNVLKR